MSIEEFPAMVYKNNRSKTFVANCIVKNIIGFGKTEEDALNNLKDSIQNALHTCDVTIKPMYGLSIAQ